MTRVVEDVPAAGDFHDFVQIRGAARRDQVFDPSRRPAHDKQDPHSRQPGSALPDALEFLPDAPADRLGLRRGPGRAPDRPNRFVDPLDRRVIHLQHVELQAGQRHGLSDHALLGDHQIRTQRQDGFHVRAKVVADFRLASRLGRVVTERRDAHDAVAQPQGVEHLGDARRRGDNPPRLGERAHGQQEQDGEPRYHSTRMPPLKPRDKLL